MIFSDSLYSKPVAELILTGAKTCTRRLAKEGEHLDFAHVRNKEGRLIDIFRVVWKNKRLKWEENKSYSVQLGRGKPCIKICSKCGYQTTSKYGIVKTPKGTIDNDALFETCNCKSVVIKYEGIPDSWKPLRITITGIRRERLLDISETDAKNEGYELKARFVQVFCARNWKKKYLKNYAPGQTAWNPKVWVLSFCVKGVKQ